MLYARLHNTDRAAQNIPNLSLQVFAWDVTSFSGAGTHRLSHAKILDRKARMLTFLRLYECDLLPVIEFQFSFPVKYGLNERSSFLLCTTVF